MIYVEENHWVVHALSTDTQPWTGDRPLSNDGSHGMNFSKSSNELLELHRFFFPLLFLLIRRFLIRATPPAVSPSLVSGPALSVYFLRWSIGIMHVPSGC